MEREDLSGERLFVIRNFLSPAECRELIARSEKLGYETFTLDGEKLPGFRNNARAFLTDSELAKSLWNRAAPVVPEQLDGQTVVGLCERFRFYRYTTSESFVPHYDGVVKWNGAESKLTFLVYLSDVARGGETNFFREDGAPWHSVRPQVGHALVFEHLILHEGAAVAEGTKYVLRTDVLYSVPDDDN